jgi:energy-coupling factor transporter ATP-binding protein EcfA2
MRMVSLRIAGFRRFERETTLDLTPRVLAVVGPNEAGKSTLLDALEYLSSPPEDGFGDRDFSGWTQPDGEKAILSALFEVEEDDQAALAGIPGAASVRLWHVWRKADGSAQAAVIPEIERPQEKRRAVREDLGRLLARKTRPGEDLWLQRPSEVIPREDASEEEAPEAPQGEPTVEELAVQVLNGLSELLLPALFREAAGLGRTASLQLQVAGGLASTPPRLLPQLEGEAGHVVYLTDSDSEGLNYEKALLEAGVAAERIFTLRDGEDEGLSIEDLVEKSLYVEVVNLLAVELRGHQGPAYELDAAPEAGIAKHAEQWANEQGIESLPKPAVAEHLLRLSGASLAYATWDPDAERKPRALLRASRGSALRGILSEIRERLALKSLEGEPRPVPVSNAI